MRGGNITDYELFSAAEASSITAWMASASAKSSRLAQAQSDRRFQKTTIARLGAEILSMGRSLESLCADLRMQYDSLATFRGQLGGGRNVVYKKRIEENKQKVVDIIDDVFDEGHDNKFSGLTDVEIGNLLVRCLAEVLI